MKTFLKTIGCVAFILPIIIFSGCSSKNQYISAALKGGKTYIENFSHKMNDDVKRKVTSVTDLKDIKLASCGEYCKNEASSVAGIGYMFGMTPYEEKLVEAYERVATFIGDQNEETVAYIAKVHYDATDKFGQKKECVKDVIMDDSFNPIDEIRDRTDADEVYRVIVPLVIDKYGLDIDVKFPWE